MKSHLFVSLFGLAAVGGARAEGLYYTGNEDTHNLPLHWSVGVDAVWDDNVNPTGNGSGQQLKQAAFSLDPYVGLTYSTNTPQTTSSVNAKLGLVYYIDKPSTLGTKDVYPEDSVSFNYTYRFDERLRFASTNYVAYQLEPNYSYGFATSRQSGDYLYVQTDDAIGYRWSERVATYTGITITALDYADNSVTNQNRFTWLLYNQFRYQLTPQSLLTAEYRYSQTTGSGVTANMSDQYLLVGLEQRFSPSTVFVARVGAQMQSYISDVVGDVSGKSSTSPYVELALNTSLTGQFQLTSFLRYGIENYDNVRVAGTGGTYDFIDLQTLRIGVSGQYALNSKFSLIGGVDYIASTFDHGSLVAGTGASGVSGLTEDLVNAYVGLNVKLSRQVYGTLSYNFTNSASQFSGYSYDRNRVSVGVRAEF